MCSAEIKEIFMKPQYSKKCRYGIWLILCIAGMVIFDRSLVFVPNQGFNAHMKVAVVINVFAIGIFPVLMTFVPGLTYVTDCMLAAFAAWIRCVRANWRKAGFYVLLVAGAWLLSFVLEYLVIAKLLSQEANASRQALIFTVLLLGIVIYGFRNRAGSRPEQFYLITALILGGFLIWVSPATLGTMNDDEVHYLRTIEEANFFDGARLEVENKLMKEYEATIFDKFAYDRESRKEYYAELNALYDEKKVDHPDYFERAIYSIAYLPAAIGTIVGEGLSLSFVHVFMMGKFFNLLCYALLIYFAIRRIRYGKVLLATFGLLPTNLYMAANYSYDPWVIGWIVLAFAYYFEEIQNPDRPLQWKNVICIVVFLLLGCMPKAVYCVMALPFLFMPKKKFASKKMRMCYYLPVIIVGAALLGSFLIPVLANGAGAGDVRGGTGVNADAQLAYIFAHPGEYMGVLARFLKQYLSVGNAQSYLQMYFHFGNGAFVGTTLSILVVTAFLDRQPEETLGFGVRLSTFAAGILAVVACATAMYIAYTSVASAEIGGCQGRYFLPAVFPILMAIAPDRIDNRMNRNVFTMVPLMMLAGTFLYNIYGFCVCLY